MVVGRTNIEVKKKCTNWQTVALRTSCATISILFIYFFYLKNIKLIFKKYIYIYIKSEKTIILDENNKYFKKIKIINIIFKSS